MRTPAPVPEERRGSPALIGALQDLTRLGRSSRYGLRRHGVLRASLYEGLASERGDEALRGRALRILGRPDEARAAFDRSLALEPGRAETLAWRWELELGTRGRRSASGIERAVREEPGNAWWRTWRGLSRLPPPGRRSAAACRRALADFEAALTLTPELVLALGGAALARGALGRPSESVRLLDRAIALEPRQAWLRRLRARARLDKGDLRGFADDASDCVLLDEGLGYFALAFGTGGDYSALAVRAAADRFLARRPKTYWMHALRGDCRRAPEIGDFAGGLRDLETAVALRSDCAWAWGYLARARMAEGPAQKALDAADKAVALSPDCGWLRVWRGEIRRRAGDPLGALADLDRGLELDPDYDLGYSWRGGAKRQLGRPAEALADLDVAAGLDPAHAWTRHERSLALRALGRTGEALTELDAAHALDPKFSWCDKPDLFSSALSELSAEVRARPRNPSAWAWRGELRLRMGQFRRAERDLREASRRLPLRGWAFAWRARALDALGRRGQALKSLDRAIRLDPRHGDALAWRGLLLRDAGRLSAAAADLRRAVLLQPTSAWIWIWKAETELALGRLDRAAADVDRGLGLNPRDARGLALRAELETRRRGRA